jgi:hypothetical protein
MVIFDSESEIIGVLEKMEGIVRACIEGEIELRPAISEVGRLHGYYALDGHESDEEETQLLARYRSRIEWLEAAMEEVGGLCAEADATKEAYIRAGRFGEAEALRRLRAFVEGTTGSNPQRWSTRYPFRRQAGG